MQGTSEAPHLDTRFSESELPSAFPWLPHVACCCPPSVLVCTACWRESWYLCWGFLTNYEQKKLLPGLGQLATDANFHSQIFRKGSDSGPSFNWWRQKIRISLFCVSPPFRPQMFSSNSSLQKLTSPAPDWLKAQLSRRSEVSIDVISHTEKHSWPEQWCQSEEEAER